MISRRGFLKGLGIGAASVVAFGKLGFAKAKETVKPVLSFCNLRPNTKYRVTGMMRQKGGDWEHIDQTFETSWSWNNSVPAPLHINCRCHVADTDDYIDYDNMAMKEDE